MNSKVLALSEVMKQYARGNVAPVFVILTIDDSDILSLLLLKVAFVLHPVGAEAPSHFNLILTN